MCIDITYIHMIINMPQKQHFFYNFTLEPAFWLHHSRHRFWPCNVLLKWNVAYLDIYLWIYYIHTFQWCPVLCEKTTFSNKTISINNLYSCFDLCDLLSNWLGTWRDSLMPGLIYIWFITWNVQKHLHLYFCFLYIVHLYNLMFRKERSTKEVWNCDAFHVRNQMSPL